MSDAATERQTASALYDLLNLETPEVHGIPLLSETELEGTPIAKLQGHNCGHLVWSDSDAGPTNVCDRAQRSTLVSLLVASCTGPKNASFIRDDIWADVASPAVLRQPVK